MDYTSYAETGSGSGISIVLNLALSIATLVAWWVLFDKAGKDGWRSIIPFLNAWEMFDIIYGAGWKFLLLLVPVLNFAVVILYPYRLAKAFGRSTAFAVLTIFFTPIMLLIMAFDGKSYYVGPCSSFL